MELIKEGSRQPLTDYYYGMLEKLIAKQEFIARVNDINRTK